MNLNYLILIAILSSCLGANPKEDKMSASDNPKVEKLELSVDIDGNWSVIVGDKREAKNLKVLLKMKPNASAEDWANIVNELKFKGEFNLIDNPKKYEEKIRGILNHQDKDGKFDPRAPKIRDFGIPDFDKITTPQLKKDILIYFVEDNFTNLPYKAKLNLNGNVDDFKYEPLELKPVK